ncbi:acyl-CoA dehydrogenase [Steroidobacter denitrificans]|uniref:3-methylmercaptopropionyl-CoA dehydrogenase n=1 Tax=Steroidobacter denitrificans TaxID=465721 RepID=A0A127F8H5_STEDE|nr:acyl-CoA dehydrogenase [Steroidobacter denitrificans]AMN45905.1 acyl-CoA dehydrogenase [Steroidobacter denitrificans]
MYHAPLKELGFVLHQLIDDGQLEGLPGLAEYSPEFADSVLQEAAKFAEQVLDPINVLGDQEGAKWTPDGVRMPPAFKEAYRQFVAGGWPQLRATQEYGGQGAPTVLGTAVEELWGSANLAFKLCPMLTQAVIEAIHRCGTSRQKDLYLPRLIRGEWTGTMNLTEPQAGSDLGAIRMRAIPEGDSFRLHGQKIFITYGEHDYTPNIIHMVLARIEGAPAGIKGISMFIVPRVLVGADGSLGEPNDVRCVSIEHKLGIHSSPTCVLSYGEKAGAVGYLVGEPNRGLEYMFIMMNAARLSVGLEGYALSERAYQHALAYARERVQGRPAQATAPVRDKPLPIVFHADIKRMLLAMKSQTEAARAVALYGALQLDLGRYHPDAATRAAAQARGDLLIPIIKAWATEMGVQSASLGVQVHGGMGFIEETGAAQYYRDVRITTIYEGTTGIQANDLVGRKVGRDGGTAMGALIADMLEELRREAPSDSAGDRSAALAAVELLKEATAKVLEFTGRGPEHVQAIAVPYLMLSGYAIGAWLMARAQSQAAGRIDEDRGFYSGKLQTTRFFLQHALHEVRAQAAIVTGGGGAVVEADPDLF